MILLTSEGRTSVNDSISGYFVLNDFGGVALFYAFGYICYELYTRSILTFSTTGRLTVEIHHRQFIDYKNEMHTVVLLE